MLPHEVANIIDTELKKYYVWTFEHTIPPAKEYELGADCFRIEGKVTVNGHEIHVRRLIPAVTVEHSVLNGFFQTLLRAEVVKMGESVLEYLLRETSV